MKRRQSGFTFIEILVVMGIIVVLVGMVAVIVPRAQEEAKKTESTNNVRNMVQLLSARSLQKGWPRFDGKKFVLYLAAAGEIDARNPDNLKVFFSPGDVNYRLDAVKDRFREITIQALKSDMDVREYTSYAGRRNTEREYVITPNKLSMGVPIICDDDDGPIHHTKGLIMGWTNGSVSFKEWADLEMLPPEDPDMPEPFLGDNAPVELLEGLSSD
jgi:prepilin-type N-terminal cleavage/methylation domain-containing protein